MRLHYRNLDFVVMACSDGFLVSDTLVILSLDGMASGPGEVKNLTCICAACLREQIVRGQNLWRLLLERIGVKI